MIFEPLKIDSIVTIERGSEECIRGICLKNKQTKRIWLVDCLSCENIATWFWDMKSSIFEGLLLEIKKSRNISECKEEHLREPFSYKNHATFYTVKKKEGSCFNGLRTVEQFSNNYNCDLSLWWWAWRWLCLENRCNRLSRPVKWLDDVIVLCCCSFLTVLSSFIFKFSMKVKYVFLHQASWECSSFV